MAGSSNRRVSTDQPQADRACKDQSISTTFQFTRMRHGVKRPTVQAWPGRTLHKISAKEDFIAEGLALRTALLQASELSMSKLSLKSDDQNLIRAIKELFGILHDIDELNCSFSSVFFYVIPRKDNITADCLAKEALNNSSDIL